MATSKKAETAQPVGRSDVRKYIDRIKWEKLALCSGENADLFFPPDTDDADSSDEADSLQIAIAEAAAMAVCKECPVIGHCAITSIEDGEENGVRAGMNLAERQAAARGFGGNLAIFGATLRENYMLWHPDAPEPPPILPPDPALYTYKTTVEGTPDIAAHQHANVGGRA